MRIPEVTAVIVLLCGAAQAAAADGIDFDRQLRPLLSENCFPCHGPDGKAREAELRLDTREDLYADRGGYRLVVAGKPDESELYRRVTAEDVDERMPPADSGLQLSGQERALIRQWIAEGAGWSGHWSFEPLGRPAPPPVAQTAWPRNDVDRFVLARLEAEGLAPSPAATRETLIRRVTLDLTGLPPTPAEVDAFLQDHSHDAYEKLVDRLLASPRYGQRMAWEWLDASRYADTDGFQGDPTRTMWPWRDWLIDALNRNMPYDRFTIELLAGDLLSAATPEQVIATGFNRNHMHNGEGGRIPEETRVENVFDRTETTATVWLGLTMTCCRCHDHKYDPISQREYYQLFAFFNNTSENGGRGGGKAPPVVSYLSGEQRRRIAALDRRIAALQEQLDAPLAEVDQAQAAWEVEAAARLAKAKANAGTLTTSDWSRIGPFPAPGGDAARAFEFEFEPERKVDLQQKYLDGKLAWQAEPKFVDGQVHTLSEEIGATYLYRTLAAPSPRIVEVSLGSDDGIKIWLNGKLVLANNAQRGAAPDQDKARLELTAGTNQLLLKIVNVGGPAGFYYRKTAESLGGLPADVAEVILREAAQRSDAERAKLRQYYRQQHSEPWQQLKAQLTEAQGQRTALDKSATTVMVMDELPAGKRRTTPVLFRGIYNKPLDEEVTSETPSFLPALPADAPRDRLTLARWLVSDENPLTARVTVNRAWQTFFARGLVETSEDFGRQGSRPSHPQLLDWLAGRFVDSGWDVKALHKLIVSSAAYRQSSRVTPQLLQRDPDNRLLARGARSRLPSWMLRDQALAAGGLLVDRLGGPPVRPYQPEGVWEEATFGKIRYEADQGDRLYRRSLYIFWRRIVGPTMLFDAGKRQTCEVKPTRTNSPLHALTTLNETTFVEAARGLAQRVMKTGGAAPQDRLALAFRLAAARQPRDDELALLVRRWQLVREDFAAHPDRAEALLSVGQSPRDARLAAADHAAYTAVCSLILNLDEVLSRE